MWNIFSRRGLESNKLDYFVSAGRSNGTTLVGRMCVYKRILCGLILYSFEARNTEISLTGIYVKEV